MKVPRRFANRKAVPPESPLTWEGPSRSACLGLYVATRDDPTADVTPFRNRERVMEALDYGFLHVGDTVKVGARVTTAGRFLVGECLPEALRAQAAHGPCTALKISTWLDRILNDVHVEIAARCAEALERLGRRFVDGSGVSFSIGHLATPDASRAHVSRGRSATLALLEDLRDGNITDGER